MSLAWHRKKNNNQEFHLGWDLIVIHTIYISFHVSNLNYNYISNKHYIDTNLPINLLIEIIFIFIYAAFKKIFYKLSEYRSYQTQTNHRNKIRRSHHNLYKICIQTIRTATSVVIATTTRSGWWHRHEYSCGKCPIGSSALPPVPLHSYMLYAIRVYLVFESDGIAYR